MVAVPTEIDVVERLGEYLVSKLRQQRGKRLLAPV